MIVEFQQQKQDLIDLSAHAFTRRLKPSGRTVIAIVLLSHFIGSLGSDKHNWIWSRYIIQFSLSVAILYILLTLLPALRMRAMLRKMLASYSDNIAVRIVAGVQELSIEKDNTTTAWDWKDIQTVKLVDKNVCILTKKELLLIPAKAFPSDKEAANFLSIVKARAPIANSKKDIPGSHLYSRGWLGLIPLVGFFVGLVLFIRAVFDYKNRKLAFIGLACMLFTVAIYGSLFAFMKSKAGRSGFAEIDKSELNTLVQNIEYYHLQRGIYPDSLEQLRLEDSMVMTYDAVNDKSFNYQKIGDRYTVFSSGLDGIPGTADDIYPVVFVRDSSKIGFTRHLK